MIEQVAGVLVLAGAIVALLGAIGLLRLPGFINRLHAVGVIDTLGAWLVLLGLLLLSDSLVVAFKVFLVAVLIFLLAPVGSHALARSSLYFDGNDESGEDKSTPGD